MLHGNVKTFHVIFNKMGEESTRAFELALEGHSLFISGQKHNFKPKVTKGKRQISKVLVASLLLAALLIFSPKHKRRGRQQTVGNRFEFFDFIPPKETFRRK